MGNYQLSEAARADLDRLYLDGILEYGLKQADAYYDGLIEKFDLLGEHPSFGNDYSNIYPELSRYEYQAHAIYYVPAQKNILIVRILGGKQDPARHI